MVDHQHIAGLAEHFLDLARAAAPGLTLRPVELVETGWDSTVLRATDAGDGRWVFRFPRREEVLPDLDRERALLMAIRAHVPVAVPDWQIHAVVGSQVVIGYPELPGAPAGEEPRGDGDFEFRIAVPPPAVYAEGLGRTLAALHRLEPDVIPRTTAADLRASAAGMLDGARHLPVPPDVLQFWHEWMADDQLWDFATTLTHGDVHPGHTMIDDDGALVGIIDWTDAGWGDPAADFVDQRHAFGPAFGTELLERYADAGGFVERLAGRIVRWQSFGPLAAATFGLTHQRPELVDRALERMHRQATRLAAGSPPV